MTVDEKIRDIEDVTKEEIKNGANFFDVEEEKCYIDGEEYPMFYAKIINKQIENEMPFVLFLGKPGTGKTFASAKLGYDLTNKIGFYNGKYRPSENIKYKNIPFLEKLYESRNTVLHKPDINATLKVIDHHEDENRAFETFIHLSRIFGNLITGDAQYLWRCDTGVQITHTFRIVATSDASDYAFDVYYIDRKPDAENKEVDKTFLQRWRPKKPPGKFEQYIEDNDLENKKEIMEEALDSAKGKDKEDDLEGLDLA